MQRYRVNYKLLIGLVIGAFISAGSAYGLWWWQVDRNADDLIVRADNYVKNGEPRKAILSLYHYKDLRPDDARALIRYGRLAGETATNTFDHEWSWTDVGVATEALNEAVTKTEIWKQALQAASGDEKAELLEEIAPREDAQITEAELKSENAELRQQLVEILFMRGEAHKALDHLEKMLAEDDGSDSERTLELETQRIQALAITDNSRMLDLCRQLTGFDGNEFDEKQATNPHVPQAYWSLALDLRSKSDVDKEKALQVIERMVEMNPDLAEAHIKRHLFMQTVAEEKEKEAATQDAVAANGTSQSLIDRAERRAAEAREAAQAARTEAEDALARAYQLDPEGAASLQFMGRQKLREFADVQEETMELLGVRADSVARELSDAKSEEEVAQTLRDARIDESTIEPIIANWTEGQQHLAEAVEFFDKGVELYPEDRRFYEYAANALYRSGDMEGALKVVDRGLAKFPLSNIKRGLRGALSLSNTKVDILLTKNDIAGIEDEIRTLRDTKADQYEAAADFHQARIYMVNQQWKEAEQILTRTFPQLMTYMEDDAFRDLAANAGMMLGMCQEQLGSYDLAYRTYETILTSVQSSSRTLERLRNVGRRFGGSVDIEVERGSLEEALAKMRQLPPSQRDWDAVIELIDRQLQREEISEGNALIKKARVRIEQARATADKAAQQESYDAALSFAQQAIDAKGDPRANLWLALPVIAAYPESGPQRALQRLQDALASGDLPDTIATRELHVKLLGAVGGQDAAERLTALTEDMDQWQPSQQGHVLAAVAWQLNGVDQGDEAWQMMQRAAQLAPTSLPTQKQLFELAFLQKNDDRMETAQQAILEIVERETDPEYVLSEARRLIIAFYEGNVDEDDLAAMQAKISAALAKRSDWSELQYVSAQISALSGNTGDALGVMNQRTSSDSMRALQVKLLASQGRFEEAYQQLRLIPAAQRTSLFGRLHAEILKEVGNREGAYEAAREYFESGPSDPGTQLWYAELARAAGHLDEAESTLLEMARLSPSELRIWEQLVMLYVQQKDADKVAETLRKAQLGVDEDMLPNWMASYYQMFGRWDQAEKILLSIYGHRLDEPFANRKLAQFYLSRADGDKYGASAAAPYLNRILKAVYAGQLEPQDAHASWARRQAAQLLFAKGDYPNSVKAERLLTQASESGAASPEDTELLTAILSSRRDPPSLLKLADILKDAKVQGGLSPVRSLLLGQTLSRVGKWDEAKIELDDAVARHTENARLLAGYASLLIEHGEYGEAERMIRRVSNLPNTGAAVAKLRVALAGAKGDTRAARQVLQSLAQNLNSKGEPSPEAITGLARLAEQAGDHKFAKDLMSYYSKQVPAAKAEQARLEAFYGDAKRGLGMLQDLSRDEQFDPEEILVNAVQMYRMRRAEVGNQLDVAMNQMIRRAIRVDSASARRLISEAEVLEVQQRYDEAAKKYQELLGRSDIPDLIRATAANNLAYVLALEGESAADFDRAVEAANEAIALLGPISDVLDTRAVAYLARQDYELALSDMELAVQVSPSAGKYYHLAKAHLGLGNAEQAITAWNEAKRLGLGIENIAPIEQDDLYRFTEQIESLVGSNAQL